MRLDLELVQNQSQFRQNSEALRSAESCRAGVIGCALAPEATQANIPTRDG